MSLIYKLFGARRKNGHRGFVCDVIGGMLRARRGSPFPKRWVVVVAPFEVAPASCIPPPVPLPVLWWLHRRPLGARSH